ncbi:DUF4382 domain-containing protein [Sphingobacterium sp. InxBP1]|uniref:DUF4382 domain-containing protein n=1 Tax=Sphingobacterium sp. InxBP1 TaxID=2870328 RepID=UPI002243E57C|nr:DUF4382 domain-containing protein [Sphingobacterium sp. InxBP1]MCW8313669.1 DUF4382 domain-containing protein [Sphingobacterium sp. InxBP1]
MKINSIIAALATVSLLGSCSSDDTPSTQRTPVTIKITDAPAYYDAIELNIDEIEIRTTSGSESIDVDGGPFNILNYTMGKDTVIAGDDVPSGMIQEIRLKLEDEGNQIWVDGVAHPLNTPSGQSSGVKIKIQDELIPNVAYTLLLDFDASKSIVRTGNGQYLLKPVIRAIPVATSGAITGTVSPAASLAHVFAINGTDTVGTLANDAGKFYFPGMPEGTYKVKVEPSAESYNTTIKEDVQVVKGSVTDVGIINVQ